MLRIREQYMDEAEAIMDIYMSMDWATYGRCYVAAAYELIKKYGEDVLEFVEG